MTDKKTNITDPVQWVDEYGDILFNYAYSKINSRETAEDIVQDTYLAAFKNKEGFEGKSTVKTWLFSILKRKIIDHYRKNSINKEDKLLDSETPFHKDGILKGFWDKKKAPKHWGEADQNIESEEFRKILEFCISRLPEKWAACFKLKSIEELSTEEICKELEISSSNLWVMIHRAKLQLRDCMGKNWFNTVRSK